MNQFPLDEIQVLKDFFAGKVGYPTIIRLSVTPRIWDGDGRVLEWVSFEYKRKTYRIRRVFQVVNNSDLEEITFNDLDNLLITKGYWMIKNPYPYAHEEFVSESESDYKEKYG